MIGVDLIEDKAEVVEDILLPVAEEVVTPPPDFAVEVQLAEGAGNNTKNESFEHCASTRTKIPDLQHFS